MSNHYHLLIETPKANLSRIMQHINGLYTQRHNRKRKKDGVLFRGRYKSVLVDEDGYLLQLSRYIHRNPLEVKGRMVVQLEDYPWSSYPAYINKVSAPDWLERDKTYQMLGQKYRYKGYRNHVEKGVDEDIKRFYSKGNILSVLGDKEFKEEKRQESRDIDLKQLQHALDDRPSVQEVIKIVSQLMKVSEKALHQRGVGQRKNSPERAFAIYACQHYSDANYREIADNFGLTHVGSLSHSLNRIRTEISSGEWQSVIKSVEKKIYVVKYT